MFNFSMCSSVGFSVCCGSKELIFGVSPRLLRSMPVSSVTEQPTNYDWSLGRTVGIAAGWSEV